MSDAKELVALMRGMARGDIDDLDICATVADWIEQHGRVVHAAKAVTAEWYRLQVHRPSYDPAFTGASALGDKIIALASVIMTMEGQE